MPLYGLFDCSGEGLQVRLVAHSYDLRNLQKASINRVGVGLPKGFSGTYVKQLTDSDINRYLGGRLNG